MSVQEYKDPNQIDLVERIEEIKGISRREIPKGVRKTMKKLMYSLYTGYSNIVRPEVLSMTCDLQLCEGEKVIHRCSLVVPENNEFGYWKGYFERELPTAVVDFLHYWLGDHAREGEDNINEMLTLIKENKHEIWYSLVKDTLRRTREEIAVLEEKQFILLLACKHHGDAIKEAQHEKTKGGTEDEATPEGIGSKEAPDAKEGQRESPPKAGQAP